MLLPHAVSPPAYSSSVTTAPSLPLQKYLVSIAKKVTPLFIVYFALKIVTRGFKFLDLQFESRLNLNRNNITHYELS